MFSAIGVVILGIAFLVLVITFFWVARLLGIRGGRAAGGREKAEEESEERARREGAGGEPTGPEAEEGTGGENGAAGATGAQGDQPGAVRLARNSERRLLAEIEETEKQTPPDGRGVASGANYGLILGILACLLFRLSPLMSILSAVGLWYSGRALFLGLYRYRVMVYRALIGMALALISVGLHLYSAGLLSEVISLL